jgi:hypothetical protein
MSAAAMIDAFATARLELKSEEDRADDQHICDGDVPADGRVEKEKGDDREDNEGDAFLKDLQLRDGPFVGTDPISWYLKYVLKERQTPAGQNDNPKGLIFELEVAVPGKVHEGVRDGQENDRLHFVHLFVLRHASGLKSQLSL